METQLGAESNKSQGEIKDTKGCHARFSFLLKNYINHLNVSLDGASDEAQVSYHRVCAFRTYFIILVDTDIFMDKCATYVDVVYIKCFAGLNRTYEYNWRYHV